MIKTESYEEWKAKYETECQAAKVEILTKGARDAYTTDEVTAQFDVLSFCAPFCVVIRKRDGVRGHLQFQHSPRVYFNFTAGKGW